MRESNHMGSSPDEFTTTFIKRSNLTVMNATTILNPTYTQNNDLHSNLIIQTISMLTFYIVKELSSKR